MIWFQYILPRWWWNWNRRSKHISTSQMTLSLLSDFWTSSSLPVTRMTSMWRQPYEFLPTTLLKRWQMRWIVACVQKTTFNHLLHSWAKKTEVSQNTTQLPGDKRGKALSLKDICNCPRDSRNLHNNSPSPWTSRHKPLTIREKFNRQVWQGYW